MPDKKLNLSPLSKFVRAHVIMGTDLYEQVVAQCVKDQQPMYALVERALRDYLAQEKNLNTTKKER